MKEVDASDLPEEKQQELRKAKRLEIGTLVFVATSATFLYLTMGSSQAMKTSFFEDVLSAVPSVTFLVCARIARKKPNLNFPYGYHGVVSIGYLVASLALVVMGLFLSSEAILKLVRNERVTIGGMTIFGHTIWAGWPMFAAIAYTSIPAVLFGRAKMKLAPKIHDKILYADATMMKADWMAESATAVGVLGVGLGWWWLDPIAALFVSADILKDGVVNMWVAMRDMMEHRPMKTDRSGPETIPAKVREYIEQLDWVEHSSLRMREVGHVFFGEVFITPRDSPDDLPAKIREAVEGVKAINWRIHDVTITVLDEQEN